MLAMVALTSAFLSDLISSPQQGGGVRIVSSLIMIVAKSKVMTKLDLLKVVHFAHACN